MTDGDPCCSASRSSGPAPSRDDTAGDSEPAQQITERKEDEPSLDRMVRLSGGAFTMGTDSAVGFEADGEGPARQVTLDPVHIASHAVTNAEFLQFVRATGYTTDAERYGWSFVFEDLLNAADRDHVMKNTPAAPWWVAVQGADWLHPSGPSQSLLDDRALLKHPVTHVSWNDAMAYCDWSGERLPTEAEWEYAARGGLEGTQYAWGDELHPDGEHRCNIWQGEFPDQNTVADGYFGTAPVSAFEPNDYGLYNVAGNVWEWCADWFSADYHTTDAYDHVDPTGPDTGQERVMRGGSHLCHRSWCNRYRVAARSKNAPDSSTTNIGFRCVVDAVAE